MKRLYFALAAGLMACTAGPGADGVKTNSLDETDDVADTDTHDTDSQADTDDTDGPTHALSGPDWVRLPFVTVGEMIPSQALTLTAIGSIDALELAVEGDFSVTGDLTALSGAREFAVTYTGSVTHPGNSVGTATFRTGERSTTVGLAAVVGDPGLPASITWTDDGRGMRAVAGLPSAPFPYSGGAWFDDSVFIWLPHGADGAISTVTHLHGHNAVIPGTTDGQNLPVLMAQSGRNAVLIAPQGPYSAASGDFGRLMEPGGHANLVRDVFALLYRDGWISAPLHDQAVLTSHSGGYRATARIMEQGGLPITTAHLFDSLYGEQSAFAEFALHGGLFRSNYTTTGGTATTNTDLANQIRDDGVLVASTFDQVTLNEQDVIIGHTPAAHGGVMSDNQNFSRWLLESGLSPNPMAPPELLETVSNGTHVTVSWRMERGAQNTAVIVEGSSDGTTFIELTRSKVGTATVPATHYVRVRRPTGDPSDAYPASGRDWLIVDGFDRVLGGSYSAFTHDFSARVGEAIGNASGASNESVTSGRVVLTDYDGVVWMLGDEGLADRTFDDAEMALIDEFVDAGGQLVVSGAEVGFATESSFLSGTLHAGYVRDDANTTRASGFDFGVAYEEDFPDVLSGQRVLWEYDNGGGAAVAFDDRVVVVGFGIETIEPSQLSDAVYELTHP